MSASTAFFEAIECTLPEFEEEVGFQIPKIG